MCSFASQRVRGAARHSILLPFLALPFLGTGVVHANGPEELCLHFFGDHFGTGICQTEISVCLVEK